MNDVNTDCSKCKAPMPPPPKPIGCSPIEMMPMTITAYLCPECGHVNDLKRRKPKRTKEAIEG